jgi:4-diphosphocytidyl-2-C-methyl-D-erythritol kinase
MNFRAYAKINIGLRILGKRSDGYHNIETVFHQIDLYDELLLEPAQTVKLTTTSPGVPGDSTNLCIQAAELIRDRAGRAEGINIHLTKRIPVGAGLGGGSSDAATVLVALNRLWQIGMTPAELELLGAQLGSDVPFFVQGGTAAGTSRGEILEHFDLNIPYWILTVTPRVHISTAWAYSNVQLNKDASAKRLRLLVEESMPSPEKIRSNVSNDFEELVYRSYPEIKHLKERLNQSGALFSQLSGSGSSVYGFFRDEGSAQSAAAHCPSTCATSVTAPSFKPMQLS